MDLNHRPHPYQGCALTKLSYRPYLKLQHKNTSPLQKTPAYLSNNMRCRRKGRADQRVCFDLGIRAAQVLSGILRKEVIQPQVLLRLPCYDFTPVVNESLGACLPKVSSATSALVGSHGVTGGVYKARERIHRGVLIRDY